MPWQRPRGVASGAHRKSGVIYRLTSACPAESYLPRSAYFLLTPLSRTNCKLSGVLFWIYILPVANRVSPLVPSPEFFRGVRSAPSGNNWRCGPRQDLSRECRPQSIQGCRGGPCPGSSSRASPISMKSLSPQIRRAAYSAYGVAVRSEGFPHASARSALCETRRKGRFPSPQKLDPDNPKTTSAIR